MKYLIFGTGDYYDRYKAWFCGEEVLALLDNAEGKQGSFIDGIQVMRPEDGIHLPFDYIVILSFYVKDMKRQLMNLGVGEDRIYHFYDLYKIMKMENIGSRIQYFGNAAEILKSNAENKILLLSQDMMLGGASIALLHAAVALKQHGYQIIYASMIDGPLREKIMDYEIPVIVDRRLQIGTMKDVAWTEKFSMILCNTVNFHVFLSDRNAAIPVIWWLHDSLFFYDGIDENLLGRIDRTNLHVVSVGAIPQKAIQTFLPSLTVDRLLYGVEDCCTVGKGYRKEKERIVFVCIGYIEARKGQDILIQAIKKLDEAIREKTVFYLVGQDTSLMAQKIRNETRNMPGIIMTGMVGRAEIDAILDKADVLVCPSREDPMPTVATEAMMHSVPCLLSDVTGTAEYIQHGENGVLFRSEDVYDLTQKIEWCISHGDLLADMGIKAREIYEEVFSMNAFKSALFHLIETIENKKED